jgi:hypothetical protein
MKQAESELLQYTRIIHGESILGSIVCNHSHEGFLLISVSYWQKLKHIHRPLSMNHCSLSVRTTVSHFPFPVGIFSPTENAWKKLSWAEFVIWPCQTVCIVWLISSMKNTEQMYRIRVWVISVWTLYFPKLQAVFIRISSTTKVKPR